MDITVFIILYCVFLSFIAIIASLIFLNKIAIEKKINRKNLFTIFLILFFLTAGMSIFSLKVSTSIARDEADFFRIEKHDYGFKILSKHKRGNSLWLSYFTDRPSTADIRYYCKCHLLSHQKNNLHIYFFDKNDVVFSLPPSDLATEYKKNMIAEYHVNQTIFRIKEESKYYYDFLLFRWGMALKDSDYTSPASPNALWSPLNLLETKPVFESKAHALYKFAERNEKNAFGYGRFRSELTNEHQSQAFLLRGDLPFSVTLRYRDEKLEEGSIEWQKAGSISSDYKRALEEAEAALTGQYGSPSVQDYPVTLRNPDGFFVIEKTIWTLPRTEIALELLSLKGQVKIRINFKKRLVQ